MRGEWRANELTLNGMVLELGLDRRGRIDWASSGNFNLGALTVDRFHVTGRVALNDAASRRSLELTTSPSPARCALAGFVRGDGNFVLSGMRYPFRVSSGQSADGNATRVHFNVDPGARAILRRSRRRALIRGTCATLRRRGDAGNTRGIEGDGRTPIPPWRISAKVKADPTPPGSSSWRPAMAAKTTR